MTKVKRIVISPDVLFRMLETGSSWKVEMGIPEGSRFTGLTQDHYTQTLHFFVENDLFDEIQLDKEIAPSLDTLFKKL